MIQIGMTLLVIWLMNFMWIIWEVLRCTPDWKDEGTDVETIAQNFLMNSSPEKIQFIKNVGEVNPWIGLSAVTVILLAMM